MDLSAVSVVLCACCGAEVCLSIVQAVMIYVVNEHVVGDFEDLAVHLDDDSLAVFLEVGVADGVKGACASGDMPFVFAERFVVVGVNYGVFGLGQAYAAEGIAEAEAAIEKGDKYYWALQPSGYVNKDLDDSDTSGCW